MGQEFSAQPGPQTNPFIIYRPPASQYNRMISNAEYYSIVDPYRLNKQPGVRHILLNCSKNIILYDDDAPDIYLNDYFHFNSPTSYNKRFFYNVRPEASYISAAIYNEVVKTLTYKQETVYYDVEPKIYSYLKERIISTIMVEERDIYPYHDTGILLGIHIIISKKIYKTIETQANEPGCVPCERDNSWRVGHQYEQTCTQQ